MLHNKQAYIEAINVDSKPRRLDDRMLPGGKLHFKPGETISVPAQVFLRSPYWLKRADSVKAAKPAKAEKVVKIEVEAEEPKVSMAEIRKEAEEKGITLPFGCKKKDAIALVRG